MNLFLLRLEKHEDFLGKKDKVRNEGERVYVCVCVWGGGGEGGSWWLEG